VKGWDVRGELSGIQAISARSSFSLALGNDGSVYAWGYNANGQLGYNTTMNFNMPVNVLGMDGTGKLSGIQAISAGSSFSLALGNDGSVYAWGANEYGQLGNNSTTKSLVPVKVKGPGGTGELSGIHAISAGSSFSLALGNDGSVYAWGNNGGQLGNGTTTNSPVPVKVKGVGGTGELSGIKTISAGTSYSLALGNDGSVYAWGSNYYGQLGNGTTTNSSVPVKVKGPGGTGELSGIQSIAADGDFSLALENGGSVYAWGSNYYGQLGNGSTANSLFPALVGSSNPLFGIHAISAAGSYALAFGRERVFVWGNNTWGQLGDGTTLNLRYAKAIAICSNGSQEYPEGCDDGNTVAGDGCSATCSVESGWTCSGVYEERSICQKCPNGKKEGTEGCDDNNTVSGDGCSASCAVESGYACTGTPSTCATACGDGGRTPNEACDDANTVANDGCSTTCTIESGYSCSTAQPNVCQKCGNGKMEAAEACDDGNSVDFDGCSKTCTLEPSYNCTGTQPTICQKCMNGRVEAPEQCDDGNSNTTDGCTNSCIIESGWTCNGVRSICQYCGNARKEGTETCDDGQSHDTNGDGCSTTCQREPGWYCTDPIPGVQRSLCYICGNGIKDGAEPCDDGNNTNGDGCTEACVVETGWTCGGWPSVCQKCGNGVIEGTEMCDDGNTVNSDGCSHVCSGVGCSGNCKIEFGYDCIGAPSSCRTVCGNGARTSDEQCDDGNIVDEDGCSSSCITESGYTCSHGQPNICQKCGNGKVEGSEADSGCDDGNAINGDGCSAVCGREAGYTCTGTQPSVCHKCGNGVMTGTEACDDNNVTAGDGCSATCTVETLYICNGTQPSICQKCRNGKKEGTEGCDDGNSVSTDGCTSSCVVQSGWTCNGTQPSVCQKCPNGKKEGTETCDDNNSVTGDGCDASCMAETGFVCTGTPTVCATVCGDGVRGGNETCDDANTAYGDGCSDTCTVETPPVILSLVEGDHAGFRGSAFSVKFRVRNTGGKARNWKIRIPLSRVAADQESNLDVADTQPAGCTRTYDNWEHIPAAECTFTLDTNAQVDFPVNFQVASTAPCQTSRTYAVAYLNEAGQNQTGPALSGALQVNCGSSSSPSSSGPVPVMQAQVTGVHSAAPGSLLPLTFSLRNVGGRVENWKVRIPLNQGGAFDVSETQPANCTRTFNEWELIPAVECSFTLDTNAIANFPVNFQIDSTASCQATRNYALQYFNASGQAQTTGHQQLAGTLSVSCVSSSSSAGTCGNGIVEGLEQCDNDTSVPGDGCSATCQRDPGWICSGSPSVCQTLCGDHVRAGTEQCDDGDVSSDDGCSDTCQIETTSSFSSAASSAFSTLSIPSSASSAASARPLCGNTRVELGEQCERGAAACPTGYGCDYASCQCLLLPPTLPGSSRASSTAPSGLLCGDRVLAGGEQCESGIPCLTGSYCTSTCQCLPIQAEMSSASSVTFVAQASSSPPPRCGDAIPQNGEQCEVGMPCSLGQVCDGTCLCIILSPVPNFSSAAFSDASFSDWDSAANTPSSLCGNALTEPPEECDDQNLIDDDGCSPFCTLNAGFTCSGSPSTCQSICGDGIHASSEECDDGNFLDGDGCSALCTSEHAAPPPPPFLPICGNGILEESEECDDANPFSEDGCSSTCTLEMILSSSSSEESSFASSESSSSSSVITLPTEPEQSLSFWQKIWRAITRFIVGE